MLFSKIWIWSFLYLCLSLPVWIYFLFPFLSLNIWKSTATTKTNTHSLIHTLRITHTSLEHGHEQEHTSLKVHFISRRCWCAHLFICFFLNFFFCSEIEFDGVSIHATVFMYIYCLPAQISKCFGCALVQNRKFPHCHPTSISHHHHRRRYHHHSHPSPTSARTSSLINFVVSLLIYSIWESKGGG